MILVALLLRDLVEVVVDFVETVVVMLLFAVVVVDVVADISCKRSLFSSCLLHVSQCSSSLSTSTVSLEGTVPWALL